MAGETRDRTPVAAPTGSWRAIGSAFSTALIGIGLARFAYTPLVPAIIAAHWFQPAEAAYLGAANLAGYLAGALLGRSLAVRSPAAVAIRPALVVATVSFIACGYPLGFACFFAWRVAAGLAGGILMVVAAPAVLPHVAPSRRGLAAGIIFTGVGIGVVVSGTIVPLLLRQSVQEAWFGLGGLSLLLSVAAWNGWPSGPSQHTPVHHHPAAARSGSLRALYVEYGLNALAWVPHMIFLVDYVARGLHEGIAIGADFWVLFGIGATVGPVLAGHLADRAGFGVALRLAFLIEAGAVAVPGLGLGQGWLIASSLIVGAFLTGTVALVLGRIAEILPHHPAQQKAAWSKATVVFALFQAGGAYLLSYVYAESGGNYRLLFLIGGAAMTAALAIDLVVALATPAGAAPYRRAAQGEAAGSD